MKVSFKKALIFFFFLSLGFTGQSCFKKGYGCPGENAVLNADKDGELSMKRGKSRLFSKKMRKRSKRRH